jgi:signal peptidase I
MKLRWFLSATVRQATDLCKHVQKLLNAQRDILSPQALAAIQAALREARAAIDSDASAADLQKQMEALEKTATKWIKPYPYAEWRDNVEVFLVAIVVAMGIRTFFLQPFKIPTGSMQPTLYGVTTKDFRGDPDFKMPGFLERTYELLVHGAIYHQFIAPQDGQIVEIGPVPVQQPWHLINRQTIWVQYAGSDQRVPLTLWCGPDDPAPQNDARWLYQSWSFHKGNPILCFKETTGDHLFVDRLTYNFRHPKRGEIIVFKTRGIERLQSYIRKGPSEVDQFYIKRLIGLGGETVSIGDDRHVRINGRPLDAGTPHFANVYGFDPKKDPEESHYSGHVFASGPHAFLRSLDDRIEVPPRSYVVFGDNTVNSLDSRYWGELPEQNVIGTSFFVYWPITARFGWGQQ